MVRFLELKTQVTIFVQFIPRNYITKYTKLIFKNKINIYNQNNANVHDLIYNHDTKVILTFFLQDVLVGYVNDDIFKELNKDFHLLM